MLLAKVQSFNEENKSGLVSILKTDLFYNIQSLKSNYPQLINTLNCSQSILDSTQLTNLMMNSNNEFSFEARGKDWAGNADSGLKVRIDGVKDLLKRLNKDESLNFDSNYTIVDFLAGNGYVNQVANLILGSDKSPQFINSDLSYFMFRDALKNGLFSVWQSAENPFWIKSSSVDAVLYAYGTHHIQNRSKAIKEGARNLKDGGRLVIHDFEEGSPMATWFADIVSNFSKTRHDYPHFSQQEMFYLAENAGLKNIKIEHIDDPFVIVADTKEKALYSLSKYVMDLYGLVKFNGDVNRVLSLIDQYFGIHSRQINDSQFEVKIVRNALVCSATK
ncbi:methyltransferase domain-containing protein [Geminocystis sp. GBBB08]|uniref:class I SAM-dependent methyltransferase n=1 Tax=Geminocystis sp. GBBB08 TaxID=2604140 RepID=UPI0027E39EED|nr:methyltransferase domain-containing protein [Geminocystis sp. GBBB08]MBL1210479.1 class I SAM-dependent methyltransferase [Geminocystis sp. GBBB08]